MAFTYNDPVIFAEYAMDVAEACRAAGRQDGGGHRRLHARQPRAEFYAHMDAANVDLKGFTEEFLPPSCCGALAAGAGHAESIWSTRPTVWLEITNLLIPGQNDSEEEIDEMADWFVEELGPDVPLHFTAFHPDFQMLDRPPTPPATLSRARAAAP